MGGGAFALTIRLSIIVPNVLRHSVAITPMGVGLSCLYELLTSFTCMMGVVTPPLSQD